MSGEGDIYGREYATQEDLEASAPVQKITIVPRTSGTLGYTMQAEEQETITGEQFKEILEYL